VKKNAANDVSYVLLDDQSGWFAATPCVVKVPKGVCVAADEQ
jgi:hypothetical protein